MKYSSLHILFIFHGDVDPQKSGVARVNENLAVEFIRRGASVYAITEKDGFCSYTANYQYPNKIINSIENREFLQNICRKHEINVAIVSSPDMPRFVYLASCLKDKATIIGHYHQSPKVCASFLEHFAKKRFACWRPVMSLSLLFNIVRFRKYNRFMMRTLDKMVVLSPSYIDEVGLLAGGYQNRCVAIANPFPPIKSEITIAEKRNTILYVGRINEEQKKISTLIDIWSKVYSLIPKWNLKIVGGASEAEMEYWKNYALTKKMNNYSFEGYQDPEQYYREAKIILMTSAFEGFPMVLVEAMQYGCVPIAFNTFKALSDIIDDSYNGYSIKPYKKGEYIRRIIELTSNEDKLTSLSSNAKNKSKKFETKKIFPQWDALFADLFG